jgi:hypothetical protein
MTGAMKMRALLLISLAACGGKTTTTPTTGGGGASGGGGGGGATDMTAAELWAPVMKQGAIFTFTDRIPEGPTPEEFTTVEATVSSVSDVPGGKSITLAWTINGDGEETFLSLPPTIIVTDREVRFPSEVDGKPTDNTWPATTAVVDVEQEELTAYIHEGGLAGERCYGLGPPKDAGECGDVCYTELCVHPKHGITGGSGLWWPDFSMFHRRDLSK